MTDEPSGGGGEAGAEGAGSHPTGSDGVCSLPPGRGSDGVEVIAEDLDKTYRDGEQRTPVLTGLSLRVAASEMVAIVGASGSGKSTLLHLLGGLDRPDAGTIRIGGQLIQTMSRRDLADFRNQTLGFVFQFHQLLPDFDALENIMMPGRIAGMPVTRCRQRAWSLLEEVELTERATYFPTQLSGGERQRVALCRALLLEPPLLLADEPTGNLDPKSGETVFRLLLELRSRRQTTAILVTHNPDLAHRCGRVLSLSEGVLHPQAG